MVPGTRIKDKLPLLTLWAEKGRKPQGASPLEVSWVEPTARDLRSPAVNQASGLNHDECEDKRKWTFITGVKKTQIHTFPPKSGKEQQVLLLRNPNKKLHSWRLNCYCRAAAFPRHKCTKWPSILKNAEENRAFQKTGAISPHRLQGNHMQKDLFILSRPRPWCTSDHDPPISPLIKCLIHHEANPRSQRRASFQFQEHQTAPLVCRCRWQVRGPLSLSGIEETSWILPSEILAESPREEKHLHLRKLQGRSEIKGITAMGKHLTYLSWFSLPCVCCANPGTLSHLVFNVSFS